MAEEMRHHGRDPGRRGPSGAELEKMVTKEEALKRIFDVWTPQAELENIPLADAAGRVLAEDLTAQYNIPVVRASAMDGVAIRYADVKDGLPDTAKWRLGRDFVRADTGDDFADGFDTVIPIEEVALLPEGGLRFADGVKFEPGRHIRSAGSQIRQGAVVGKKGTVLTALDLSAIGMGGYDTVRVVRKPKVAFVPTGSELVPAGSRLRRGQNFDTNSLMAAQMIREMGGEPMMHAIIQDDPSQLRQLVEKLLDEADIIILNAGTSKGGEDYCGQLLDKSGESLFHGVRAVPGRPMSAAILKGKAVLNLSGPSLAAFYSMDWMIRPLVCRFLGIPVPGRPKVQAVLTAPLRCPPPMSLCCMLNVCQAPDGAWQATPLQMRGPHGGGANAGDAAILTANAMYVTVPGEKSYETGDMILLELLRDIY